MPCSAWELGKWDLGTLLPVCACKIDKDKHSFSELSHSRFIPSSTRAFDRAYYHLFKVLVCLRSDNCINMCYVDHSSSWIGPSHHCHSLDRLQIKSQPLVLDMLTMIGGTVLVSHPSGLFPFSQKYFISTITYKDLSENQFNGIEEVRALYFLWTWTANSAFLINLILFTSFRTSTM